MNANQDIVIECPDTNQQQSTEDSMNSDEESDVSTTVIANRRRICLFVSALPLLMSAAALFTVLKLNPSYNVKPSGIDLPTSLRGSDGDDDSFVENYLNTSSGALNETLLADGESTSSTVITSSFEHEESKNEDGVSSTTSVATSTSDLEKSVVEDDYDGTPSAITSTTTSMIEAEFNDLQSTTINEATFATTMPTVDDESIEGDGPDDLTSTTAAATTSSSIKEESTGEDESDASTSTTATATITPSTSHHQSVIDSDDMQSTTLTTDLVTSSMTHNQSVIDSDDMLSESTTVTTDLVTSSTTHNQSVIDPDDMQSTTVTIESSTTHNQSVIDSDDIESITVATTNQSVIGDVSDNFLSTTATVVVTSTSSDLTTSNEPSDSDGFLATTLSTDAKTMSTSSGNEDESDELQSTTTSTEPAITTTGTNAATTTKVDATTTSDAPTCEDLTTERQCKDPFNNCVWFTPLNWDPLCFTKPEFSLKLCKEIRLSEDCVESALGCEWLFEKKSGGKNMYDICRFSYPDEEAVSEDETSDLPVTTSTELASTTVAETKTTKTAVIVTTTNKSESPTCEEAGSEDQCKDPSNNCIWFTPLNWDPLCFTKPDFALKGCKQIALSEDCIKSAVECDWYFERDGACRYSQNEKRQKNRK
eukprot:scaffold50014_cov66-Cyclotella_meneghiniana.AAC.4